MSREDSKDKPKTGQVVVATFMGISCATSVAYEIADIPLEGHSIKVNDDESGVRAVTYLSAGTSFTDVISDDVLDVDL